MLDFLAPIKQTYFLLKTNPLIKFRTIVLNLKVTKMFIQILSRNWNLLAAYIQLNFPLKSILVYSLIIIHWPCLVYIIWKAVLTKILSYWKIINKKIINECLNEGITEKFSSTCMWRNNLLLFEWITEPVNDNDTSDANYYLLHRPVVREERETQRKLELYRIPQPKHQDNFL